MTTVPYDVGYWNGGQRHDRDLVAAWTSLISGDHSPHPLVALHLSEVGDQDGPLRQVAHRLRLGLIRSPQDVPDGAKESILYDPRRLVPVGQARLVKVGDAFEGRRAGHPGTVRMANKYVLTQEFRDKVSGWTPTHGVTHVWPSVGLNNDHVRPMVRNVATWCLSHPGSLFLTADWNMPPGDGLMAPVRHLGLACSQNLGGHRPVPTFSRRSIDHTYARQSGHYTAGEQITVRLPGHELGNGEVGHKAVILTGTMKVRR